MKRILLIVALASAISAPAFAQSSNDKAAQELEKFRLETIAAFQNNDVAALDRLLADDLIGTGQAGQLYDKATLIGLIKSGQLKYEKVEIEPTKSALHGNVVVGSSIVKTKMQAAGQSVNQAARNTIVAEKRQGRWQYIAIHTSTIIPTPQEAEQELRQAIETLRQAIVKGDVAAWDHWVSDDWTFTAANGAVGQPKAAVINGFKSGALKFDTYEFSELKIQPLGNTAITSYIATFKGHSGQQEVNDRIRALSVWARSPQGHWRLLATQQTRIAPPNQ